jgi:hypothetical protein
MASARTIGLGMVSAAVTMLARNATRRAMHDQSGAPKLPRAARRSDSVTMLLIVAAASGALLALADVLQEQRRQLADLT